MSTPTLPNAADLPHLPIRGQAAILHRVESIVLQAHRRQLWFLFFDRHDCQLPFVVPMDIPARPQRHDGSDLGETATGIAEFLDETARIAEAAWLVLVYERPGAAALRPEDSAWFGFLAEIAERTETSIRAVVAVAGRRFRLIHRSSVVDVAAEVAS